MEKENTSSIQEQKIAKAQTIISNGSKIKKIDNSTYEVPSQSGNWYYGVYWNDEKWVCDCPDHNKRQANCKHIYAVMLWIGLQESLKENVDDYKPLKFQPCPNCGSYEAVKIGFKDTKKGRKQRFKCKNCKKTFMLKEEGFENMKFSPEIVTLCIDLYFKGVSLRKIAHHITQTHQGLEISHVMIYYWVKRYSKIISDYVDEMKPELGDMWATDEMMIKVKEDGINWGNVTSKTQWVWMWNVLDNETRFLIATMVSKKKTIKDARRIFQKAKDQAQGKPKVVTTDGLEVYHRAFNKVFRTLRRDCKHIHEVGIKDKINNNRVERLHGTIRSRDKVMRAMQNPNTTTDLLDGFRAYYNFVRPHMALDGKTPAEIAGLDLNLGENKWLSLITKATESMNEEI